jgi:hypothetical protein
MIFVYRCRLAEQITRGPTRVSVPLICRTLISTDQIIPPLERKDKELSSPTIVVTQYPSNILMSIRRRCKENVRGDEQHDTLDENQTQLDYEMKTSVSYTTSTTQEKIGVSGDDASMLSPWILYKPHQPSSIPDLHHRKPLFHQISNHSIQKLLYDHIIIHFVPAYYPISVQQPGYTNYAIYSFIASIAGSASMVLSTQILLSTMMTTTSVAANAATTAATAGAFNWVLKDGIGQLGGIVVASRMGHSHAFDTNPKRYRMYAAILLDAAAFLEICTPFCCNAMIAIAYTSSLSLDTITCAVLPLACLATVCKNIGYIMASASRASLHQALCVTNSGELISNNNIRTKPTTLQVVIEQRTNNNLADITAKFGSQSTAAGVLGTIVGITCSASSSWIVSYYSSDLLFNYCSLTFFMFFVGVHQSCNYIALRNVALNHLNRERLCLLLQHFVQENAPIFSDNTTTTVRTPEQVAEMEFFLPRIFYPFRRDFNDCGNWLDIGCHLASICPRGSYQLLDILNACSNELYIVSIDGPLKYTDQRTRVQLVFLNNATSSDIIRGMLHAHILYELSQKYVEKVNESSTTNYADDGRAIVQMIKQSHDHVVTIFQSLMDHLNLVGWNTRSIFVEEGHKSYRFAIDIKA